MTYVYAKRCLTTEGSDWENVGIFLASDSEHLDAPEADTATLLPSRFRSLIERHLASTPPRLLFDEAVDWLTPAALYRFTTVRPTAVIRVAGPAT